MRENVVADRVQEVRLAETRGPVEEERVVGLARALGDGERRGVGEAVGAADDELLEGELGVKPRLLVGARGARGGAAGRRCDRRIGSDDLDGRLGPEDRGGARLKHAGKAIGNPAADLVGCGQDEPIIDHGTRAQ